MHCIGRLYRGSVSKSLVFVATFLVLRGEACSGPAPDSESDIFSTCPRISRPWQLNPRLRSYRSSIRGRVLVCKAELTILEKIPKSCKVVSLELACPANSEIGPVRGGIPFFGSPGWAKRSALVRCSFKLSFFHGTDFLRGRFRGFPRGKNDGRNYIARL